MKRFRLLSLILCLCPLAVYAQTAEVGGAVQDPSGAVIPNASVEFRNQETGVRRETNTNKDGYYHLTGVDPGKYDATVQAKGFKTLTRDNVSFQVGDKAQIDFKMQVGDEAQTITVDGSGLNINTTDASVSTVIDRQFIENIPLNGRSFQSLIELTPGVTAVPGAGTNAVGELSVNGQRTEANNYTVDGVSANTGMADLSHSGVTPAETALGTTQSLASVDALQEFRITSSTYSAEFGRMPGAQISFQTRSGTNAWHGTTFDYFRNDVLDANNWFNDNAQLPKTAERQNDFGGTFSGPVEIPGLYMGKDKTFFFFSYEGLRLTVPQPAFTTDVPDASLRQNSAPAIQPFLNAFPNPNGAEQGSGLALFTAAYSQPSNLDAYSIRIDQAFNDKVKLFGRYSDTPSQSQQRLASGDPANLRTATSAIRTGTFGATLVLSPRITNEARLNYTYNNNATYLTLDNFGGAVPLTTTQVFPGVQLPVGYEFNAGLNYGTFPGLTLLADALPSHQWNFTDSITAIYGSHTLKFGVDYRRSVGVQSQLQLGDFFSYSTENQVLTNNSPSVSLYSNGAESAVGTYVNFSSYVQDEWKVSRRLQLSLGLRWDLNPAPTGSPQPYTLDQIENLDTAQLAPAGTSLYQTQYDAFAPRIGIAYRLHLKSGHETVVRSGLGVFYDVLSYDILNGLASGGIGIGSSAQYANLPFPLTADQQTLLPPSTASPYNSFVNAPDPHLRLPYTLQWNAAIEQALGNNQALTISYVGAGGRKLLFTRFLFPNNPAFANFNGLETETNSSTSSYNALQIELQRRLSRGLQALASYTWSHSIDNLSTNQVNYSSLLRGNSDFDVRHSFSAALTYNVPGRYSKPFVAALFENWGTDLRETARSALPVDIQSGYAILPNGQYEYLRPDVVPTAPIYVKNSSAPGGRVVNFNAFATPSEGSGDAPRNFVRGFDAVQTDLSLRRSFKVYETLQLQFRAESFNLLNHPNFGTIYNSLSDGQTLFGRANTTLNNSLGGLNPLYQLGGPRSLQLALKLVF